MNFTLKDIRQLANAQSFQRGQAYYNEGAVSDVIGEGDHFEAEVEGSETYSVSLDILRGELDFECDCPYDYDGICKHCVALGLAILNKKDQPKKKATSATKIDATESFSDCYQRVNEQIKLQFLEQILKKDFNLQNQFVTYVSLPSVTKLLL